MKNILFLLIGITFLIFSFTFIVEAEMKFPKLGGKRKAHEVKFQKFTLDKEFRSEGVAVGDINHDGKMDVMAGNFWYEAPDWKAHEIAPAQAFDAAKGYSNSFVNFAWDVNNDGWVDQILIDTPGIPAVLWRENPGEKGGVWAAHKIAANACNESPALGELMLSPGLNDLGSGGLYGILQKVKKRDYSRATNTKPALIFSVDDSQMNWFEPGTDVNGEFIKHPISIKSSAQTAKSDGVFRYSHGLGVGDINGDGRNDVVINTGYWEAPLDPRTAASWKFVKMDLGEDCANMQIYDVNGDGLNDVITSSAHKVGIWWFEQYRDREGAHFRKHEIDNSISQTHSLMLADINGDGLMDFVTGKRYWAHGPTGDINPDAPAVVVWFELQREKGGEVKWIKHEIDNDSGVGTQFTIADMNGDKLPDVITSNKKGVHVFLQVKGK